MFAYFLGTVWTAVVVLALLFVIAGERLFHRIGRVKRFNEVSRSLQRTQISGSKFGRNPLNVKLAASKPLYDLKANGEDGPHGYLHYPFGEVIEIAYVRDRRQRVFVRELKGYCGLLGFLFVVGLGNYVRMHEWNLDIPGILHEIGEKPLEFLGLLELAMISIIGFRLAIEVRDMSELMEKSDE